jgi:hypothetical protein
LLTFAHEDPFDGFKYGMSKEETFKVIEQKVEEGIFKKEAGSKRWLLMPKYHYYSETLNRKVILQARFRFVKKKLADVELQVFTGGSIVSGGFAKGRANALLREVKRKFEEAGSDLDWELFKIRQGYYNLYLPQATVYLE